MTFKFELEPHVAQFVIKADGVVTHVTGPFGTAFANEEGTHVETDDFEVASSVANALSQEAPPPPEEPDAAESPSTGDSGQEDTSEVKEEVSPPTPPELSETPPAEPTEPTPPDEGSPDSEPENTTPKGRRS